MSHRWSKAIDASLWSIALRHCVSLRNNLPSNYKSGGKKGWRKLPATFVNSPLSKLSDVKVKVNLKHFHLFESSVYMLEPNLQSQQSHNKWTDRYNVGIFLTNSPVHSSNVPLMLNTSTGNVSSQLYCLYDDEFATCKCDAKFNSVWQAKVKLDRPTTPVVYSSLSNLHFNFTPPQPPILPPSKHHAHPQFATLHLPDEFHHSWDDTHSNASPINTPDPEFILPVEQQNLPPPPPFVPLPPPPIRTVRLRHAIQTPMNLVETAHSVLLTYAVTFTPSV